MFLIKCVLKISSADETARGRIKSLYRKEKGALKKISGRHKTRKAIVWDGHTVEEIKRNPALCFKGIRTIFVYV